MKVKFWSFVKLGAILPGIIILLSVLSARPFPELDDFLGRDYSKTILDRKGELISITTLDEGLLRLYLPLEEYPRSLVDIVLGSEDRRFYIHPGVDPFALLRSGILNIRARSVVSGGSTISMQLAGMIKPRGRSLYGKLKECTDALRLEYRLGKRRILELYLNSVPFGFQTEGYASGARRFFGRNIDELTQAEMAVLVIIPRNPSYYNPYRYPERIAQRGAGLTQQGGNPFFEEEMVQALKGMSRTPLPSGAPHFTRFLFSTYGGFPGGDQVIRTTLDGTLNDSITHRLNYYLKQYTSSRITNGAVLLLENRTGGILAYVGSGDFYDRKAGQIDGVQVRNQPGSCLKPFLYALAMENGFRPNTILPDIPTEFGGEEVYVPLNFDNRFHGPLRLRVALASSLNVPAVYTLQRLSVRKFTGFLEDLGFRSVGEQKNSPGVGLALGNVEVSLFELVQAFSLFPGRGIPVQATPLLRESHEDRQRRPLISPYSADIICDILSDPASRTLAFGAGETFRTPVPMMFKTGTSNQYQNIWALAATPAFTMGVWMGNHSGDTVVGRTGSSVPALLAKEILAELQVRAEPFPGPAGSKEVEICTVSGQAAGPWCESTTREFLPVQEQVVPCTFHRFDGERDITVLPEEYRAWVERRQGRESSSFSPVPGNGLHIVYPVDGAVFVRDPGQDPGDQAVRIEAAGADPDGELSVVINGRLKTSVAYPFVYYFPLETGEWHITILGTGDSAEITITVR